MNHDPKLFCRVCADTVSAGLRYAIEHQGRPDGGGVPGASDHVAVTVRRGADGRDVVVGITPARGVSLLGPPRPALVAHVAWLGGDVLAAAPVRSTGEHDFRGSAAGEPPQHRFTDDGSTLFEFRIAVDRLRDADLTTLRVGGVVLGDDVVHTSWIEAVQHPATRTVLEPRVPVVVSGALSRRAGPLRLGPAVR